MMGGTMRSPLTAMFFAVELTHDWNLLPGLLVACVAAYAVTVLLMRRSILTEKVARRGHHVFREYAVDPFDVHRVGEVMDRRVPTVPTSMSVHELARLVAGADPELARRQGTPIVDSAGRLVGIVTRSDLMRALEREPAGAMGVLEAGIPAAGRGLRRRADRRGGGAHALQRRRPAPGRRPGGPHPPGRLPRARGRRRRPPAAHRRRKHPREAASVAVTS